MTKVAWVFPGQGSQSKGMGLDLQTHRIAQKRLAEAEQVLGWSVLEKCEGDEETLSRTLYTQPCLYTIEAILVDLLRERGKKAEVVAGHSLGEYTALYAAGVYDFTTGLELVQKRAQLMDGCQGGKMVALMKFDRSTLEELVAGREDVVIANDNSEEQVVISGTPTAVDEVVAKVKAKLAVPLKVSGAFHSPLMAEANQEFTQTLEKVEFQDAQIPVISNVHPIPTTCGKTLKESLKLQMTGSVRWREIMSTMVVELGVTDVFEVGPGRVLTGLFKRTFKELQLVNIASLVDLP
ncbi:MAG: ACP S-malonyltransferase [Geminocystis sp.]|nr:ACP S-malonyltransferase [Geminocystis sp.]HIK38801.1 ACP S-malonyltransferase [Geminocystis sp. M7585_C2015_104]MCS7147855.1 ACP S-malonyltransferase [Geminocystis sp.]MCX8079096.1 ACP S-malonyltransferase [Geminocystis sp.]MDW8117059.1 ACP S-malonyltransferase [Geminocystis sp.]